MFIVIVAQSAELYLKRWPDCSRYDNDLKYRYVLMRGGGQQVAQFPDARYQ